MKKLLIGIICLNAIYSSSQIPENQSILPFLQINDSIQISQVHESKVENDTDSFGICIGRMEFTKLVSFYSNIMRNGDSIAIDDAIILIRIYNTINTSFELRKDSFNHICIKLFFDKYMIKICEMLNCYVSKGLSLYSKEYKIRIGGFIDKNSVYCIIDD